MVALAAILSIDVVRAALLGAVGGSCVPFAAEGTRQYLRHRRFSG